MQAAQAGDRAAFQQLVDRYLPRIHRFILRIAGPAWADDLTQEAFLRAFERRASFQRSSGSFCSWIHSIARNLVIDFHRRKRPTVALREEAAEPATACEDGPAASLQASEAHQALEQAIGRLQEPFRTTVVLCLLEGMSYEEAGAVFGCPAKTISSRLARGRAQLREALAGWVHSERRA